MLTFKRISGSPSTFLSEIRPAVSSRDSGFWFDLIGGFYSPRNSSRGCVSLPTPSYSPLRLQLRIPTGRAFQTKEGVGVAHSQKPWNK